MSNILGEKVSISSIPLVQWVEERALKLNALLWHHWVWSGSFPKTVHAFVDRWFVFKMISYSSRPPTMCEQRQDSAPLVWPLRLYCKWIMTSYWYVLVLCAKMCHFWKHPRFCNHLQHATHQHTSANKIQQCHRFFSRRSIRTSSKDKENAYREVARRDCILGGAP